MDAVHWVKFDVDLKILLSASNFVPDIAFVKPLFTAAHTRELVVSVTTWRLTPRNATQQPRLQGKCRRELY